MYKVEKYIQTAVQNEKVFRNILRDLRDNREKRPMGQYISEYLDPEMDFFNFLVTYSMGNRYGSFTICNFTIQKKDILRDEKDIATIAFSTEKYPLSGGGAILEYLVNTDKSVCYKREIDSFEHIFKNRLEQSIRRDSRNPFGTYDPWNEYFPL